MIRHRALDMIVVTYVVCSIALVITMAVQSYSGVFVIASLGVLPTLLLTSYVSLTIFLLVLTYVDLASSVSHHKVLQGLAILVTSPISIPIYYFRIACKAQRAWPRPSLRIVAILAYSLFAIFFFVLTIGAALAHAELGEFRWYRILFRLNSYLFVASLVWYVFDVWRQKISLVAKLAWGIGVVLAGMIFLPVYVIRHGETVGGNDRRGK